MVEGRVSQREDEGAKIICEVIRPLVKSNKSKLYIKINTLEQPDILEEVKKVLAENKGDHQVYVVNEAQKGGKNYIMVADKSIWVSITDQLIKELQAVVGEKCVAIKN